MFELFIAGKPAPQGSKTPFISKVNGLAGMKESSKRTAPWRKLVLGAAGAHVAETGWVTLEDCAVRIDVVFYFPRTTAARKRSHPYKVGPGDIDKLQRSLFDALTIARVWGDDAQVCEANIRKEYADPEYEQEIGARVKVWKL